MSKIDVHPNVFKAKDPRVTKLLTGTLPLLVFAAMIKPTDPFILVGNTIHMLTEDEFFASRKQRTAKLMTLDEFKAFLQSIDVTGMQLQDKAAILKVRQEFPSCPVCKYNKYKNRTLDITNKYNIKPSLQQASIKYEYPQITSSFLSSITDLAEIMPEAVKQTRRECLDCVLKHVSSAFILQGEILQGYTEHLPIFCGHLNEAIQEAPKNSKELLKTLEFCLAKTNREEKPFMPIAAVLPHVDWIRNLTAINGTADKEDTQPVDTQSDIINMSLTDAIKKELDLLCGLSLKTLIAELRKTLNLYKTANVLDLEQKAARIGTMAVTAERISLFCPETAKLLRNYRLMYANCPSLMLADDCDFKKLLEYAVNRLEFQQ